MMMRYVSPIAMTLLLAACGTQTPPEDAGAAAPSAAPSAAPPAPDTAPAPQEDNQRPMDEVPTQETAANGDRHYGFKNGCVVILEPTRAVMKNESAECELHHRDIALLYASGD